VWTFLADNDNSTVAPAMSIAILGIIMIAISRKK
jgi:hypothetical protein